MAATGRLPLVVGAVVTFVAAVAFDVLAGEHPTHTLGLAIVALAVAGLRLRLAGRRDGVLAVVSGAVVIQPVLHATAKLGGPAPTADGGVLHVVAADGPTTAMHIAVSAAIVVGVATSGQLAQLLLSAFRQPVPLLLVGPPPAPPRVPIHVCTERLGSMLRWCGWSLEAARRGPPSSSMP